jgi:hypothetical protein
VSSTLLGILVVLCIGIASWPHVTAADELPPVSSCLLPLTHRSPSIQTRIRPRMQFSILSPSGLFRIHYDTLGLNAVPTLDADRNGIPDYVDSAAYFMDSAYHFAIDTLGYRIPPRDYVDSSSWDVYLVQLGTTPGFSFNGVDLGQYGLYGATFAEDIIPTPCNGMSSTAFIFLDNDYSSRDSIGLATKRATYTDTGYTALAITCFHEFHHVVQYGYAYGISPTYYEMTSVWIEQRAFPTVTNYTQYVRRLFTSPTLYCLSCDRSIEGSYGYSIAVRYLAQQLGDSIIRHWWEGIGQCSHPAIALDSVIAAQGQSFRSLWCTMLPWLYWTAWRAREGYFSDAQILPPLQPDNIPDDQLYSPPAWMRTISLYPLQFKLLRAVLPADNPYATADTVDFVVTNPQIRQLAIDARVSADYSVRIDRTSGEQLGTTPYYCTRILEENCDFFTVNAGKTVAAETLPIPNPVVRSFHQEIQLPVPEAASAGQMATITLLSSEGITLWRTRAPVTVNAANKRSLVLPLTDDHFPKQGIVLVLVEAGGQRVLTKLAIVP